MASHRLAGVPGEAALRGMEPGEQHTDTEQGWDSNSPAWAAEELQGTQVAGARAPLQVPHWGTRLPVAAHSVGMFEAQSVGTRGRPVLPAQAGYQSDFTNQCHTTKVNKVSFCNAVRSWTL